MFNLIRNKTETRKLNKWYNKLMEKHITKEQYKEIVKEDNLYAKYPCNTIHAILLKEIPCNTRGYVSNQKWNYIF